MILEFLLVDESSRCVKTESDLLLTLECVRSVEILMTSPNLRVVIDGLDNEQVDANRIEKLLVFLVSFCTKNEVKFCFLKMMFSYFSGPYSCKPFASP